MCVRVSVWLGWSGIRVAGWSTVVNISIIRSLRLFCWITTLVVLFLVRCVLEIWCGWIGVVYVLHASACNMDTTPTQPHQNLDTHRTKNNTTKVVIQQNSRKLLMMDILMSKTCWAHKKWNKIAGDIKLVFYSSTKTYKIRYIFVWHPTRKKFLKLDRTSPLNLRSPFHKSTSSSSLSHFFVYSVLASSKNMSFSLFDTCDVVNIKPAAAMHMSSCSASSLKCYTLYLHNRSCP